ncbi:ATP-binding protein [Pedobacter sp. JCM 36344]|uniref:PAS domain-containing sensor histidine kinase n=1 Tax=Pedobacter sp. JCM 36344 TaxID=3374280 RepID=UPI00397A6232
MSLAEEPQHQNHPFLNSGGEMGTLLRSFDWSTISLGNPHRWEQSLKTTLGIILNSKFPMLLFWGKELNCFYNDAFIYISGDSTLSSLNPGATGELVWKETWVKIQPMIIDVMKGGDAVWVEDQMLPIYRREKRKDVYLTLSASPVNDELGIVAGVLMTCNETTQKVLQQKKTKENERNLRLIILQAPVAIAILRGPEYVVEIVNSKALELWGRKSADVFNKPILQAMPELLSQGIKDLLDNVYESGEPFVATELPIELFRKNKLETAYLNFVYEPLFDLEGNINGLIAIGTEVSEQVRTRHQIEETAEELQAINEEMLSSNEELALSNERLERAEEMLRFSVEAAEAATWHMELETRKFITSNRLKQLFGLTTQAEVSYKDVINKIPEDHRSVVRAAILLSFREGTSYHMEHPIIGFQGKKRWVRALGKLYPANGRQQGHFSGLIIDITEEKENELRKNDFIGMVSHELKTPLTSVMGYIQLLTNKAKIAEDTFGYSLLQKTNVQVKKMSSMINGFLNISRLESGKILIEKQVFNIDELVKEIIEELQFTITSHKINLSLCENIQVNADREKIGSVVSNLISNAIKYSPGGGEIVVKCAQKENVMEVTVEDDGIGINSEDLTRLFDRFYRVENLNTKHISGFGIGLYLSAEIIERHNGKIWASSEPEKGSVFYFNLPLS